MTLDNPIPNDKGEFNLVVVPRHVTDEMAAEVFQGWRVVRPGNSMGALRVGYMLILCRPENEREMAWFDLDLALRVRPTTVVRNYA